MQLTRFAIGIVAWLVVAGAAAQDNGVPLDQNGQPFYGMPPYPGYGQQMVPQAQPVANPGQYPQQPMGSWQPPPQYQPQMDNGLNQVGQPEDITRQPKRQGRGRGRNGARTRRSARRSRRTYLNYDFNQPVNSTNSTNGTNQPNNTLSFQQELVLEENKGPVDYYPHFSWFNRFENFPAFNRWFQDLWRSGRFTHEYAYDLIDTNFFVGNPSTVGNPMYSDEEAVDLQNFEQHFAHLQKILADEKTDQDFVMEYSKERSAHERMLRLRQTRNNVYQSILEMEKLIYAEQSQLIADQTAKYQARERAIAANVTTAMANLTGTPYYPKAPNKMDIFSS